MLRDEAMAEGKNGAAKILGIAVKCPSLTRAALEAVQDGNCSDSHQALAKVALGTDGAPGDIVGKILPALLKQTTDPKWHSAYALLDQSKVLGPGTWDKAGYCPYWIEAAKSTFKALSEISDQRSPLLVVCATLSNLETLRDHEYDHLLVDAGDIATSTQEVQALQQARKLLPQEGIKAAGQFLASVKPTDP